MLSIKIRGFVQGASRLMRINELNPMRFESFQHGKKTEKQENS